LLAFPGVRVQEWIRSRLSVHSTRNNICQTLFYIAKAISCRLFVPPPPPPKTAVPPPYPWMGSETKIVSFKPPQFHPLFLQPQYAPFFGTNPAVQHAVTSRSCLVLSFCFVALLPLWKPLSKLFLGHFPPWPNQQPPFTVSSPPLEISISSAYGHPIRLLPFRPPIFRSRNSDPG